MVEGKYGQFGGTYGSIRLRHVFRKGMYPDLNWERVLLVQRGRDSSTAEILGGRRSRVFGGRASEMSCLTLYLLLKQFKIVKGERTTFTKIVERRKSISFEMDIVNFRGVYI